MKEGGKVGGHYNLKLYLMETYLCNACVGCWKQCSPWAWRRLAFVPWFLGLGTEHGHVQQMHDCVYFLCLGGVWKGIAEGQKSKKNGVKSWIRASSVRNSIKVGWGTVLGRTQSAYSCTELWTALFFCHSWI